MATEREILKYEIDLTDVEAKAKRLLELTEKIRVGRASGQDVSGLERDLVSVGGGFTRLGEGTKRASAEIFDFERKGEKLVKGVLGTISPQLANAADMAIDLAEGFNKITPALVGVAGAGAALGLIVLGLSKMADAAKKAAEEQERLNKAVAETEGRGVDARTETAEYLRGVGIDPGRTADVLQRVQDLSGSGVRRELAMKVAASETLIEGVTGKPLAAEESESLVAGLAANPSANLTGNTAADMATIKRAIAIGKTDAAREFAQNLFEQTKTRAVEEAPTGAEVLAAQEATGLASSGPKRVRRDRPDLSERDLKKLDRLMQGESEESVFGVDDAPPGLRPGTDKTVGELRGIYEQQRGRFDDAGAVDAAPGRPTIFNSVTNNFIGTAHFGGGNALRNPNFDSPVHSPGGGLHRNGVE